QPVRPRRTRHAARLHGLADPDHPVRPSAPPTSIAAPGQRCRTPPPSRSAGPGESDDGATSRGLPSSVVEWPADQPRLSSRRRTDVHGRPYLVLYHPARRRRVAGYGGWASITSPVSVVNASTSPGRYWMDLSRLRTIAASWSMPQAARLPSPRLTCDHTPLVGFSSG